VLNVLLISPHKYLLVIKLYQGMFYLAIKLSILATLRNLTLQTVLTATSMKQLTLFTALVVAMLIVPSKVNLFVNIFILINK
jgi:Zn-dependent protease